MDSDTLLIVQDSIAKDLAFKKFLTTQSVPIEVGNFIINIILTIILAYILNLVYKKFGSALSNRKAFGSNFVLIGATTMLIISIVKSSLALSLGLVGALSIVRFRAAIKEPEELAYLFLIIGLGLGMGADQRMITIIALLIIILTIYLKSLTHEKVEDRNLFFTITGPASENVDLETVVNILKKYCEGVNLQRMDENQDNVDLSFLVEFSDHVALNSCKTELQNLYPSINISFLDYKGLYAN